MDWKIRTGLPEDKKTIEALFLEMLKAIYDTDEVEGYDEGYLDKFFEGKGDIAYVAESDGKVIGYITIEEHHEEKDYFYLDDFCIGKNFRGQGIGKVMLKEVENYAKERNIPAICLHVEESNTTALNLYKKLDYNVLRQDETRFFMVKELSKY